MAGVISRGNGVLERWNDERGFGFVVPHGGGDHVFAHISAFSAARRPVKGDRVSFTASRDTAGRLRAQVVRIEREPRATRATATRRRRGKRRGEAVRWTAGIVALAVLLLVSAVRVQDGVPWLLILGLYSVASAIAYAAYRSDKSAANRGAWRVSESSLHVIALLGGWPGAFFAQVVLRHKTIKASFQTGFWLTVATNIVLLAILPASLAQDLFAYVLP